MVRAYGWLIILGNQGLLNAALGALGLPPCRLLYNYPGVLFGLVQYMLPFAVLMLAPALTADSRGDRAARRVARRQTAAPPSATSCCRWRGRAWSAPAVVVFTLSLTDFAMPEIMGGGGNDFIANAIYDQFFRTSDPGLGAALALAPRRSLGSRSSASLLAAVRRGHARLCAAEGAAMRPASLPRPDLARSSVFDV